MKIHCYLYDLYCKKSFFLFIIIYIVSKTSSPHMSLVIQLVKMWIFLYQWDLREHFMWVTMYSVVVIGHSISGSNYNYKINLDDTIDQSDISHWPRGPSKEDKVLKSNTTTTYNHMICTQIKKIINYFNLPIINR